MSAGGSQGDLAISTGESYLVGWNERHLNYLMKRDTPEALDFCTRFPGIKILTPPAFLEALREIRVRPPTDGDLSLRCSPRGFPGRLTARSN